MSAHTPGPWKCSDRPSGPWWHIGAGNQSICTVHATSKRHTPVYAVMFKANADLIAAAPDLLAALQAYDAWADKTPPHDKELKALREQMRAAIAKATGAEQERAR